MLYQSLKSIHYRTLLIFQNKKKPNRFEGQNMGWGGDKRHVIPPMSKHGGIHQPHPPPPPPGFTPLALFRGKSPQHNRTVKY